MTITEIAEYLDKVGLQYLATIGLDGKRRSRWRTKRVCYANSHFNPASFCLQKLGKQAKACDVLHKQPEGYVQGAFCESLY